MPRRDTIPDWLSDELILGELAERELRERGLLVEEEEPPVPPLTLKEFVHEFWDVLEPGTPMAWGWALDAMCLHLEAAARRQIKRLIINVPPGTMKPVYFKEMITEKKRGAVELQDVQIGDFVLTHRGRFREVLAVHHQGILPLLEITTGRGRKIKLAHDHPVLTARGWVEAQHLTTRDVLAEVHPQEAHGSASMPLEEARLLGYLIGDGGVTTASTIFTNQDPQSVADFISCAETLGMTHTMKQRAPSHTAKTGVVTHVITLKAPNTGKARWRNLVTDWKLLHDIAGRTSKNKRVPAAVMEGDQSVITNFLASYWACDGSMTDRRDLPRSDREGQNHQAVRVDCTTISEGLARDLQHLLSRLGMSFTLRRKARPLSRSMSPDLTRIGEEYVSWQLGASDQDTCAKFMQIVAPTIQHEKASRLQGVMRSGFDTVLNPDPVRTIEPVNPGECVCLTVEEDESFTVSDLAVHNSSLTNVFFPAWVWAELNPSERFLAVAFTESLALRDSMAMRRLILSPEYVVRYGERAQLTRDNNAKGEYDTLARGRRAVRPLTAATGVRASILLIDDPNNAVEIHSPAHRRTINNAYDTSLSRRGADPKKYVQICIMQRLHEEDLTGHLIEKGGWEVLRLPEKYEPEYHTQTSIWSDPRTERGQLLFPEFRDEADYAQAAHDLGQFGEAGQLQQRPSPVGGGIVKDSWWRYHAPAEMLPYLKPVLVQVVAEDGTVTEQEAVVVATPKEFDFQITSWDLAFKGKKDSDFVVGQAWGAKGADNFLLDQTRGRWEYVQSKVELLAFAEKHPDILEHVVEDKANGPAIMSDLHSTLSGLIGWEPEGSKESRVNAESSTIQAGNVYLLHPQLAPWVNSEYRPEWIQFPNGANDDQIDPTTQALQRFRLKRRRAQAMEDSKKKTQPTELAGLSDIGGEKTNTWRR